MAATFPTPPTYAEPMLSIKQPDGSALAVFNPIWLKWFLDVAQFITQSGGGGGGAGTHNLLSGLQGGSASEYYHITAAQNTALPAAIAGTFPNVNTAGNLVVGGSVKFGTYTGGIVVQAGYVTITDSGGTSRRLLVG